MTNDHELDAVERRYPLGARVRYFPISGEANHITTTIRSEPWRLGHGTIVIKIEGRAGGVHVDHLELVE